MLGTACIAVLSAIILQVLTVVMSINILELHHEQQLLCCICSGLRLSCLGPGGGGGCLELLAAEF